MRSYKITFEEFKRVGGPAGMVARLKELGFEFESEVCPVKLRQPAKVTELADGTLFEQVEGDV